MCADGTLLRCSVLYELAVVNKAAQSGVLLLHRALRAQIHTACSELHVARVCCWLCTPAVGLMWYSSDEERHAQMALTAPVLCVTCCFF